MNRIAATLGCITIFICLVGATRLCEHEPRTVHMEDNCGGNVDVGNTSIVLKMKTGLLTPTQCQIRLTSEVGWNLRINFTQLDFKGNVDLDTDTTWMYYANKTNSTIILHTYMHIYSNGQRLTECAPLFGNYDKDYPMSIISKPACGSLKDYYSYDRNPVDNARNDKSGFALEFRGTEEQSTFKAIVTAFKEEDDCPSKTGEKMFRCANGVFIERSLACDVYDNCGDATDLTFYQAWKYRMPWGFSEYGGSPTGFYKCDEIYKPATTTPFKFNFGRNYDEGSYTKPTQSYDYVRYHNTEVSSDTHYGLGTGGIVATSIGSFAFVFLVVGLRIYFRVRRVRSPVTLVTTTLPFGRLQETA